MTMFADADVHVVAIRTFDEAHVAVAHHLAIALPLHVADARAPQTLGVTILLRAAADGVKARVPVVARVALDVTDDARCNLVVPLLADALVLVVPFDVTWVASADALHG